MQTVGAVTFRTLDNGQSPQAKQLTRNILSEAHTIELEHT
jgi:hypothetical protein